MASKLELSMTTDNAAFTGQGGHAEVSRILANVAECIAEETGRNYISGILHDANGNSVGHWSLSLPEPEEPERVTCPECKWTGEQPDCYYCEGIGEPHNPAGEILAGQCPECGALILSEPSD